MCTEGVQRQETKTDSLRYLPPTPVKPTVDQFMDWEDQMSLKVYHQMRKYYTGFFPKMKMEIISLNSIKHLEALKIFKTKFMTVETYQSDPYIVVPVTPKVIQEISERYSTTPESLILREVSWQANILVKDCYKRPIQSLEKVLRICDEQQKSEPFIL